MLIFTLTATFASAQSQLPHFDHIIIVFQENRTPDNIFGSNPSSAVKCGGNVPFEPGVDIENCGQHYGVNQWLQPISLGDKKVDPGHAHSDWLTQCNADPTSGICHMDQTCGQTNNWQNCFAYVPASEAAPYVDIAKKYGFANYMFQTNQGPSFPAHQFIFAGTSAPTIYNDSNDPCQGLNLPPCWTWFVADNPEPTGEGLGDNTGCTAPSYEFLRTVDPAGTEQSATYCTSHIGDPWCSVP